MMMIATDLDSTLLRNDKSLSDYTAQVLRQCQARGIKVVAATGRRRLSALQFVDPAMFDAMICTNGAQTHIDDKLVYECTIPRKISTTLLLELHECPDIHEIFAQSADYYFRTPPLSEWSYELKGDDVIYDFSQPLDDDILRIFFPSTDHTYAANLMCRYPQLHIKLFSDVGVYDITCTTKAHAIEALAAHWDIAMSDIVAFGDDFNDVDMLRTCGTGVAVANAIDQARAAADSICDSNENDGVAKWIGEQIFT